MGLNLLFNMWNASKDGREVVNATFKYTKNIYVRDSHVNDISNALQM